MLSNIIIFKRCKFNVNLWTLSLCYKRYPYPLIKFVNLFIFRDKIHLIRQEGISALQRLSNDVELIMLLRYCWNSFSHYIVWRIFWLIIYNFIVALAPFSIDPVHHQNNLGCAVLVVDVTVRLSSEVRILGSAAFTRIPIDHQNGESVAQSLRVTCVQGVNRKVCTCSVKTFTKSCNITSSFKNH